MKVIVLASQKGGVAKTSLSGNLGVAAELAGDGPAVLMDTDPGGMHGRPRFRRSHRSA